MVVISKEAQELIEMQKRLLDKFINGKPEPMFNEFPFYKIYKYLIK